MNLDPDGIIHPFSSPLEPRVAIITRTKDRPILLVRALSSILSQTHKNWHVYIINDGGNTEVLEKTITPYLAALDGRITVLYNKQARGVEGTANIAVKILKGDFVAIHDDDDSWDPNFLKKNYRIT